MGDTFDIFIIGLKITRHDDKNNCYFRSNVVSDTLIRNDRSLKLLYKCVIISHQQESIFQVQPM